MRLNHIMQSRFSKAPASLLALSPKSNKNDQKCEAKMIYICLQLFNSTLFIWRHVLLFYCTVIHQRRVFLLHRTPKRPLNFPSLLSHFCHSAVSVWQLDLVSKFQQ